MDGRRFLLSGPLDLSAPFTSVVELTIAGRRLEFTAGSVGLADDLAQALGVTGFDEELNYQGGVLLTARVVSYDAQIRLSEDRLVAAWRGRRYCFVTQLYGASTAELLAMLRTLRIVEHDDGLAVRPDSRAGSRFAAPATVIKQVPGLALPSRGVAALPRITVIRTPPQAPARTHSRNAGWAPSGEGAPTGCSSPANGIWRPFLRTTRRTTTRIGHRSLGQRPEHVGQLANERTQAQRLPER